MAAAYHHPHPVPVPLPRAGVGVYPHPHPRPAPPPVHHQYAPTSDAALLAPGQRAGGAATVTPVRSARDPRAAGREAPLSPSHKTNCQRHDEVQELVSQLWRAAPHAPPQRRSAIEEYEEMLRQRVAEATAARDAGDPQPQRSGTDHTQPPPPPPQHYASRGSSQHHAVPHPTPAAAATATPQSRYSPTAMADAPDARGPSWGSVFGGGPGDAAGGGGATLPPPSHPHGGGPPSSYPPSPQHGGGMYAGGYDGMTSGGEGSLLDDAGVAISHGDAGSMMSERLSVQGGGAPVGHGGRVSGGVPSSRSASGNGTSRVYDRTEHWRAGRQEHLDALRAQRVEEEAAECPFAPKINSTSSAVTGGTESRKRLKGDVVQRLYSAKKQSSSNLAAERRKMQEKEAEECTFQPQLNRNEWTESVAPRYLDSIPGGCDAALAAALGASGGDDTSQDMSQSRDSGGAQTPSARGGGGRRKQEYNPDKECTFKPKTTKYLPIHTQSYLETDAFERLSVPARRSGGNGVLPHTHRGYSGDVDELHYPPNVNVRGGDGASRRSRSASGRSCGMDDFFKRLGAQEEKRLENLEYLRQTDPSNTGFKPKVNRKSAEMVARTRFGIERDPNTAHPNLFTRLHSEQKTHRSRARSNIAAMRPGGEEEEECTFHPAITPSAQSLRPRSVDELSYGDHKRNEERRKQHALERYQREIDECPFQPTLNHSVNIKSKVSVRTDPMGFVKWAKQRQEQRLTYLENEKRRREADQDGECTFHPKVRSAPGYISTIAKSVSIAKANQKKPTQGSGPSHTFGYS